MWDTDPALAHKLMTDDCVQWSAQTPGLDTIVGPDQQEQFVTAYRTKHVNLFRPWLLIDGTTSFAYLWDVTSPDGTVRTGVDVNVLRGDLVAENWTCVADRHDSPGPDDTLAETTDADILADVCRRWVALWRGQTDTLTDLVTDDVSVFISGTGNLNGRGALAAHTTPNSAATAHRTPVIDAARGRAALLRTTGTNTGSIDVLQLRGGRIAHAWSLPGVRAFSY
jgi:hypothetical protein